MTSNQVTQYIKGIISRNSEKEIALFLKSHSSKTPYIKAVKKLIEHYIAHHKYKELRVIVKFKLVDCTIYAQKIIRGNNLELNLLEVLLPYSSSINGLLGWAMHEYNNAAVEYLIEFGADLTYNYGIPILYIVNNFNTPFVKKHLDKLSDDELVAIRPDLIEYAATKSTQKKIRYLISRGIDPNFNQGAPLRRAIGHFNIPATQILISLSENKELSSLDLLRIRTAIKTKSTPYNFLMNLKEEEEPLISVALDVYFNQSSKTPLQYLKECPQWHKTHVMNYMQECM